ncbi:hypothetical protein GCM10020369_40490 [Cryptosporangium minutisporangium]|uniref:Uncharacterized protein n=1 Tax=Cryptosporangium minutisporangium TaxID=113569 RepID=A0ABP6T1S4_9ACTN
MTALTGPDSSTVVMDMSVTVGGGGTTPLQAIVACPSTLVYGLGALIGRSAPSGRRSAHGWAAESGYADQSHLHRDVRTFAGTTPTAVAAAPWLAVDDVAWA